MTTQNAMPVTVARANGAGAAVNNGVAFAVNGDGGTTFIIAGDGGTKI